MNAQHVTKPIANRSVRPLAKTRIVSARVTETEYIALENHAWTMGKTMGDWARQSLLHELETGSRRRVEQHVFTELVGIQLLLMNTLGPLFRGERLTAEQLDGLLRQVQLTKEGRHRNYWSSGQTPRKNSHDGHTAMGSQRVADLATTRLLLHLRRDISGDLLPQGF